MSRCYHENTAWRKWKRFSGETAYAHQCRECLKRVGGYKGAWGLPAGVDPNSVPWATKGRGTGGLGGSGNSKRRARSDFYRSPTWRAQRSRILERDGHECRLYLEVCEVRATEAHHKVYFDPIEDTPDSEIIAVCKPCHQLHHERTRFED